jgi:hypothetical protein
MTAEPHSILAGDRVVDATIALASCSKEQRIIVGGSKCFELMFEMERRGFTRTAAGAVNCGRPAHQYDVALFDWRRPPKDLESILDWVATFLKSDGILLIWTKPQMIPAHDILRSAIEKCGFVIERDTVHQEGRALLARLRKSLPLSKAA